MGSGSGPIHYHHVVVDGYRRTNGHLWMHLNVGHSGFDNGWYDAARPICLAHYQNGTRPQDGGCAFNYDDVQYKEIWRIQPRYVSAQVMHSAGPSKLIFV